MDERDVIVSAFNCGGKMSCTKEAEKFAEPPLTLNVPGGSSSGFRATASQYRANNSVLDGFFTKHKVKPRRVCLISFSAGWAWTTEVLRAKLDIPRIDTIIVMDGIHTPSLAGWFSYAELAAKGGNKAPKLWMAHTQIKPPFVSAKTTNTKIIDHARATVPEGEKNLLTIPSEVWGVRLEKSITVYSKIENPKNKIYHEDPLASFEQIGNIARFEYEGNRAQDHIYNAQYAQPRYWEWLRRIWKDKDAGVRWEQS
jgi:hypothetical protein